MSTIKPSSDTDSDIVTYDRKRTVSISPLSDSNDSDNVGGNLSKHIKLDPDLSLSISLNDDVVRESSEASKAVGKTGKTGTKPKKKFLQDPEFLLDPSVVTQPLKLSDLRALVLYILKPHTRAVKFVGVKNRSAIQRVVVVHLEDVDPSDFDINLNSSNPIEISKQKYPSVAERFHYAFPLFRTKKSRSLQPTIDFVEGSIGQYERKEIENRKPKPIKDMNDLVLSFDDMVNNNYPIPSSLGGPDLPDEWVETIETSTEQNKNIEPFTLGKSTPRKPRVICIDCEMCLTNKGSELTRIALVDMNKEVILDEFVKPKNPIIDYLTQYSGITEEILEGVTTTLQDIQKKVLSVVTSNDILLGHSLENDLKAMKLRHGKVIDTALIFDSKKGSDHKPALRFLTQRYFDRIIQSQLGGHNPVEDASACIDLLKLKCEKGTDFGSQRDNKKVIFAWTDDAKKKSIIIQKLSPHYSMYRGATTSVALATDDSAIIDETIRRAEHFDLLWISLSGLKLLDDAKQRQKTIEDRLKTLCDGLPSNSSVIIWSASHSSKDCERLYKERKLCQETDQANSDTIGVQKSWTPEKEQELRNADAMNGLGFAMMAVV